MSWTTNAAESEATVEVHTFEPAERLPFDGGDADAMSRVDVRFSDPDAGHCLVDITESVFAGAGERTRSTRS